MLVMRSGKSKAVALAALVFVASLLVAATTSGGELLRVFIAHPGFALATIFLLVLILLPR